MPLMNDAERVTNGADETDLRGTRVLVLMGGSHLFGQERANIEVMRTVRELGAEVHFITSSRWGHSHVQPRLTELGFSWSTAPFGFQWSRSIFGRDVGNLFRNIYGIIATSWCLYRQARKRQATHVYTMSWAYFLFALPAIRLLRLPFVYRAGDVIPSHTRFHRWVGEKLFASVRLLVANAEFVAELLRRLGLPPNRTRVIYNYPPARPPSEHQSIGQLPAGALAMVFIGQISEHKGIGLLVEAVTALIRQGMNVGLRVAGESAWGDPLLDRLKRFVTDQKLTERVMFLGRVEDIPGLLRGSDLLVCPSLWEDPSPNVILEAKREGVPSLAFSVGGIPELIRHEIDGYLCDPSGTESLLAGIRYFVDERARLEEAGSAAREDFDRRFNRARFQLEWARVFSETPRENSRQP